MDCITDSKLVAVSSYNSSCCPK